MRLSKEKIRDFAAFIVALGGVITLLTPLVYSIMNPKLTQMQVMLKMYPFSLLGVFKLGIAIRIYLIGR